MFVVVCLCASGSVMGFVWFLKYVGQWGELSCLSSGLKRLGKIQDLFNFRQFVDVVKERWMSNYFEVNASSCTLFFYYFCVFFFCQEANIYSRLKKAKKKKKKKHMPLHLNL